MARGANLRPLKKSGPRRVRTWLAGSGRPVGPTGNRGSRKSKRRWKTRPRQLNRPGSRSDGGFTLSENLRSVPYGNRGSLFMRGDAMAQIFGKGSNSFARATLVGGVIGFFAFWGLVYG